MSQVQARASSASSSARQASRLRSPGSHDRVTPWNAVVMPLASSCASVSCNAMSAAKFDARPRLQLPFERVAVDVDDARQHQQAARVEFAAATRATDARDAAILHQHVHRLLAIRAQQHLTAGDPQPFHCVCSQGSKTICTRGVG